MDKQRNNSTISIKINGTERKIKEEPKAKISLDEIDRNLEEQIDESIEFDSLSEMAAGEAVDESFDWILPENDDEIEEYIIARQPTGNKKNITPSLKKHLKKQNTSPLKSLFFSFLLAIIVGASFGFVVLKLVITDTQTKELPVIAVPEEFTPAKNEATSTVQQLQLPPVNTFIIQGGVFSSVESAQIEEQRVKQKGIPTQIIEENGKAILILGVADSIEAAKEIGSGLKAKGIEVFAKPYTLPAKELKEVTEAEANLLKEIVSVYQMLASLSSSVTVAEAMDEKALNNQKNILLSTKEGIKIEKIEQLRVNLEGAIKKLESYKLQPKESYLTDAQQHLLTFIGTYFTL
ncbi:SPOR domain-containing protein [Bacillus sp. CGMCC 1.16607]|uniref:SPOR domain-containing protein n=1 Tax=Bacillus sp. CGMCC 1.16607 TaxID=3351842 RepID=UPI00364434FA